MPAGRPTKYQANFATQAREIIANGGFSKKKLASVFNCRRETICDWGRKHKEFSNALNSGWKEWLENQTKKSIAKSLTGGRFDEITRELDDNGKLRVTKKVSKMIMPQPAVTIFSGKNALEMRDVTEHKHGGQVDIKIEPSDELKDMVNDIVGATKSDS